MCNHFLYPLTSLRMPDSTHSRCDRSHGHVATTSVSRKVTLLYWFCQTHRSWDSFPCAHLRPANSRLWLWVSTAECMVSLGPYALAHQRGVCLRDSENRMCFRLEKVNCTQCSRAHNAHTSRPFKPTPQDFALNLLCTKATSSAVSGNFPYLNRRTAQILTQR